MRFDKVRILIVLMLAIAVSFSSAEAKLLTLDDCIEIGLKTRASIIAAHGAESRAVANKRAALGAFLPRLNTTFSYNEGTDTDIKSGIVGFPEIELPDQDRSGKSLELRAGLTAFDLANWFNYFGASNDRAKAHLDVINSEQDLIFSIKSTYYAFLANSENVAVQEQAVRRSEEQLKLIQSKYDLGAASMSDVLKQKVRYGNDRLSLLSARNAAIDSKSTLAYTIGIDPNSEVDFSTSYDGREYDGSLDEAMSYGLEHEPGLLSSLKRVDASKWAVRSRLAEYLPKLTLFGSLGWSDGTRGDTVTFNFSAKSRTVGFSLNWNIFDGFNRERNITIAKVNRNNAAASLADTRNFVSREIRTAYIDIEKLREQKGVSNENVEAATEDMKISQEKYNLGAATILDLLNAQVSLKGAEVSLLRADFDLNVAVARLERAMGKM